MNYTYLLVDLAAISVPLLFSFHPKIALYKMWPYLWPAILLSTIPFIIWDSYFTQISVWGFSPKYLLGTYFFDLPIEEILFFICIPYACLFTYYCFRMFLGNHYKLKTEGLITNLILAITVLLGLVFSDRLYTSYTAIGLTGFLLFLKFIMKPKWLSLFYYSHMFLLIPFIIVNGILTGTGLDQPIVWYNDAENMGIRFFTIPLEDVFYGMLMLLLNTFLFEFFMQKAGVGKVDETMQVKSFWEMAKF
ncbi:lycopene cyclase domain-containing protein [Dyadobacter sp. CY312]|uniref:lycopene cyclase domain-containing protein n=1 Tax=Dyadobacter sp. CY312 TaxID=2907303 RepID=UPI001F198718|nr:lycopene cyclase domain-containing protein [Dyadobacter sp. CY312]MCE7042627.1 lycopene cyclase domain-containing protein [Dyadobacter sp. CY312]